MQIMELKNEFMPAAAVPVMAVAGPFNTGKSTLINGLLGQYISPVDVIPTTSVNIHFSYGEKFQARVHYQTGSVTVDTSPELNRLLAPGNRRKRSPKILKVEINLPHQLLQLLSLVDTPGFDAAGTNNLATRLESAHHIAYLLHQRGPGETDRRLIQELVRTKGAGHLSFWINCNLGQWDGSSLAEARRVLREICCCEVAVFAINTRDPGDVDKFRSFLQDVATTAILGQVAGTLKELDQQIPALIKGALEKKSDTGFLVSFWPAREHARQVLRGRELMLAIQAESQKNKKLFAETSPPITTDHSVPVVLAGQAKMPDPAAVRARIRSLFQTIRGAPELSGYPKAVDRMEQLIQSLDREDYLVTAVGGFSSGKSTFFNALLGEALLPAENRPTTFAITRLQAGPVKEAVISYARQVQIPTRWLDQNSAVLCRHELSVLEHWLSDNALRGQITALEKGKNGKLAPVSAPELLAELEQLKATFARVKRNIPPGRRPWKSLFKKIPRGKFKKDGPADFYNVYFARAEKQKINLETKAGVTALAELTKSHLALRIDTITIRHPAAPLRLATFVDTPGLDSVYHRHQQITTHYLPRSDCFILMLSGKHILTKPDLGLIKTILKTCSRQARSQQLFIVVNFTDTLTTREQDKVRSYLSHKLVRPSGGLVQPHRIYFISARQALLGQKSGEFSRLTRHLKEQIWVGRCRDRYCEYINQARLLLQSILAPDSPPEPGHGVQKPARLQALAELSGLIKQKMSHWQGLVDTFDSGKDFVGLREGKLVIRKGFLGLSRQVQQVPSCRDLARDINTPLRAFRRQWQGETDIQIPGIDAGRLEKALEVLLAQSPSLAAAKKKVLALLAQEESAILAALRAVERHWEDYLEQPARMEPDDPTIAPAVRKTLERYLTALGQLEQNILPPGGMKDGKRQNAGSPVA